MEADDPQYQVRKAMKKTIAKDAEDVIENII